MKRSPIIKSAYAAKFAREAKEKPSEWIIKPVSRGYELIKIGGSDEKS